MSFIFLSLIDGNEDLKTAFLRGDTDAFEMLVKKYENKVYGMAYHILKNPDDAFDVTQDTFLKAYRSRDRFKGNSEVSTWLLRIAHNAAIDFVRKRANDQKNTTPLTQTSSEEEDYELDLPSKEHSPEEALLRKIDQEDLREAILSLPYDRRTVLVLRDVEGLSYEEIAEITETTLGTVKSRINRARLQLREVLLKKREQNSNTFRLDE